MQKYRIFSLVLYLLNKRKNILLSPLDWGLGHTTRLWALRTKLDQSHFKFFWAISGKPKAWLMQNLTQSQFDDEVIDFPGFSMQHKGSLWSFIKQMPKFLWEIQKERKRLTKVINQFSIHGIISDHRFGVHAYHIPSVILAHQLNLPVFQYFAPFHKMVNFFHAAYLNQYRAIWIPDFEHNNSLIGQLGLNASIKNSTQKIGLLSHLSTRENELQDIEPFEILGIISGPEPFRQQFANQVLEILMQSGKSCKLIVGDFQGDLKIQNTGLVEILSGASSQLLNKLLQQAELVIASGGYSTIMDLKLTGKQAILVPMPGQSEQQYLAQYLKNDVDFHFVDWNEIKNLNLANFKFKAPKPLLAPNKIEHEVNFERLMQIFQSEV